MQRNRPILTILAAAFLGLPGAACDDTSPLAPDNPSDTAPDFHRSGTPIESATLSSEDPSAGTIVLEGGIQIVVTGATTIDGSGDFDSLDELLSALQSGTPVTIEIEGTIEDGVITATLIRFESSDSDDDDADDDDEDDEGDNDDGDDDEDGDDEDDDEDDDDADEIHGIVAAVDPGTGIVTLTDGRILQVSSDDLIEADGDFTTLAAVAAALGAGVEIRVEADGAIGDGGVFAATSVEFESDDDIDEDDEDDEDDDDEDDDADEIHGIVAAVDPGTGIVTLTDGRILQVSSDDLIEADGDFTTLAAVAAALGAGVEILVEADGAIGDGGVFAVTSVEFESDDADDDADDEGDDDADDDGDDDGDGEDDEDDEEDDDEDDGEDDDDEDDDEDDD